VAKLTTLTALDIISGFKGTIDFYVYMGLACARRWPRSPGHRRAPAVEAQWSAFTIATTLFPLLSQEIRDAYNKMASGTGLTGRDLFTRSYLSGLYRYPTGP